MGIFFDEKRNTFFLSTKHTSYQIKVDRTGILRHLYYGKMVGNCDMDYLTRTCDRGFSGNPYDFQDDRGCSADCMLQEFSCSGTGDYRPSALSVELENGSRSVELRYESYRIISGDADAQCESAAASQKQAEAVGDNTTESFHKQADVTVATAHKQTKAVGKNPCDSMPENEKCSYTEVQNPWFSTPAELLPELSQSVSSVMEPFGMLPYVRGTGESVDSLFIRLTDPVSRLAVILLYRVFEEKDVIARSVCMLNESGQRIRINRAASLCLDFPFGDKDVICFSGRHCMERIPQRTALNQNTVVVESKRGMSSHHANPFVILCDHTATQDAGDCTGVMLMYSGSHKEEIAKDQNGSVRIVAGIHEEGFCWNLDPMELFCTPEAILSFSAEGLNGLSGNYHRILRENVCDPVFTAQNSPVLLNSWEACYFDFDRKKILDLARNAADLGVEMLVLDDGWFGARDDDRRGLGDWKVNARKLPGGLGEIGSQVHGLGLKFGLWFEPEMINEDSDLFRTHPDWALQDPGRKPVVARNQLVLDMTRQDVQDYLFEAMASIIVEASLDYIKWDFNRSVSNFWSALLPAERQGEVPYRFVLGTYSLLSRLRKAFPQLLIEGCAGGGGRFDAGMLFYCPQIWCSDNTDPIARIRIQRGTSYGYPLCTMGSHVSASPNHQSGRTTPLSTRAAVAMTGAFGYELDPAALSEPEKEEIRAQIRQYTQLRPLIREGRYYRLQEENSQLPYSAWEYVSRDRREALVCAVAENVEGNALFPYLKLRGLDETTVYSVEDVFSAPGENRDDQIRTGGRIYASGAALMYGGYVLEQFSGDYPAVLLHFTAVS